MSTQTAGIVLSCIVVPVCLFALFAPSDWIRWVFNGFRTKK